MHLELLSTVYESECLGIFQDEPIWTLSTIIQFSIITIGMIFSTVAMIFLLATFCLFVEWRRRLKNQILTQFMIARFFYTLTRYLYDVFNICEVQIFSKFCNNFVLHVSTEASLIIWMFLFTKQMYYSFVKVFNVKKTSTLIVFTVAWLTPLFIAVLSCVSCFLYYVKLQGEFICLYLLFVKWPLLIVNGVFLMMILKAIFSRISKKTDNNFRIVIVMVTLLFTFCVQQIIVDVHKIFYILSYDKDKISNFFYFATVVAVYHCAFSIFFWLFGNKRTVELWYGGLKKNSYLSQTV